MDEADSLTVQGLWVPIITPFTARGEVDEPSLRTLATRLLHDGVDGLVALGTTGEPATLSVDEQRRVVEVCDDVCADHNRGLIIGAGTNSTTETIERIETLTAGTNACAVLIVVPYYTRPSPSAVVEHYHLVADASALPVVMYNVPYRTGLGLSASDLVAAGSHSNIVAVKQAVGSLDLDTLQLLGHPDRTFDVLAGDDAFIAATIALGGSGAIAAAAHVCTQQFAELVRVASGDMARASLLSHQLTPVVTAGFAEPNPVVWKTVLLAQGDIANSGVRRPLVAGSEAATKQLNAMIAAVVR